MTHTTVEFIQFFFKKVYIEDRWRRRRQTHVDSVGSRSGFGVGRQLANDVIVAQTLKGQGWAASDSGLGIADNTEG